MIKYIFALTLLLSGSVCAVQIQGLVIRVLDGDALEILQARHPVRIRLVNIDAPEKKQPFGRRSMNQLKSLVVNTPVTVTYTQTDRYGRILDGYIPKTAWKLTAGWYSMVQPGYILISTQITPCRYTRDRSEQ